MNKLNKFCNHTVPKEELVPCLKRVVDSGVLAAAVALPPGSLRKLRAFRYALFATMHSFAWEQCIGERLYGLTLHFARLVYFAARCSGLHTHCDHGVCKACFEVHAAFAAGEHSGSCAAPPPVVVSFACMRVSQSFSAFHVLE